jgi:protein PhnA
VARRQREHEARQQAVAALGRGLSRRARSRCELCGEGGPLAVVEVAGGPEDPEEDWAALLCERCRDLPSAEPATLRFLEGAVWSETVPAKVLAVRAARELAARDVAWARDLLDGLWLEDELRERVDAAG